MNRRLMNISNRSVAHRAYFVVTMLFASMFANADAHAQSQPVRLTWAAPAAGATVSGSVQLKLAGQSLKNVNIFRNGQLLTQATIAADSASASATIDTKQFPDGALTLTARASNNRVTRFATSQADAGSLTLNVNNAGASAVTLRWSTPAANTTVSGRAAFELTGQGFQNVELFRNGQLLSRATISPDHTRATAEVDTTQMSNGALTLTAHAWNGPAGQSFTSDADAGSLTVNVNNPVQINQQHLLLGAFVGNDVAGIQQFENWLGRHVDGILGYTGNANWADYDGSVGWAASLWSAIDRPVLWSVPLIPNGANLEEAAKGSYNDHYLRAAKTLAAYRPQDAVIYIRTGWEFNGNWFAWTTHGGKSQAFIGAFRQFVTTFRSVSNRFVFEWNVNIGDAGSNPEEAYPGDAYVDIIGMDFYWNTQWDPADPVDAWNSMLNRQWGLNWHQQFAAAHGKPTAYSEWGIMSSSGAPYISLAKAWFDTHNVVYQTYWNSNSAFPGKLSDGQYGPAGDAYRNSFK